MSNRTPWKAGTLEPKRPAREPRRPVITADDIRRAPGEMVVPAGTIITPAARDLARERAVTIVFGTVQDDEAPVAAGDMQGQLSARDLASRIDHTNLSPDATVSDIASLCAEAQEYGFAAVCVHPVSVADAVAYLRGTPVAVCAVVGFPSGAHLSAIKAAEATVCVREGAREIDMVANLGWLRDGQWDRYAADIRLVRQAIGDATILKVIIEASVLDEADMVRAGILAAQSGVTFVKTSTGVYGQARLEDVRLLRRALPPDIKIKAAGGIRTAEAAHGFIAAGADRIGTSAGVAMMWELPRNR